MREGRISDEEVLEGFDALAELYGHVPPLIMWRAYEYAAYRRYPLAEPVLDLGCGDGRFFHTVFPSITDVIGIDMDPAVVELARQSGVYRDAYLTPAHQLPMADGAFGSAFANCAVEHMDHLDAVLAEVHRVIRPGGMFLMSVVSDTFVTWAPVKMLLEACGAVAVGRAVQEGHEAYHHLVNAFPRDEWAARLERAGFTVREWLPIVAGPAGWVFLLLDQLWHVPRPLPEGEFGPTLHGWMQRTPRSVSGLRRVFEGLLEMGDGAAQEYAGLVFLADKPGAAGQ